MSYTTPGARLPNGAKVIDAKVIGSTGEAVVLALTEGMASHPYATWRMDTTTGYAFHGDYCLTFEGAIRSYAARSGFAVETLGHGTVPPEDTAKVVTPAEWPTDEDAEASMVLGESAPGPTQEEAEAWARGRNR